MCNSAIFVRLVGTHSSVEWLPTYLFFLVNFHKFIFNAVSEEGGRGGKHVSSPTPGGFRLPREAIPVPRRIETSQFETQCLK